MRPVNVMAPSSLTDTFELTAVSFLGSLIIEQKMAGPVSVMKNITTAFDLASWISIVLSILCVGGTLFVIAYLTDEYSDVSISKSMWFSPFSQF